MNHPGRNFIDRVFARNGAQIDIAAQASCQAQHGDAFDRQAVDKLACKIREQRRKPCFDRAQARRQTLDCETLNREAFKRSCDEIIGRKPDFGPQARRKTPHGRQAHDEAHGSEKRWDAAEWRRRRKRLSRAILELESRQTRIEPAARVERAVGSFFHNPAFVHHDDSVGRAHGRKAVRDDDRRAMLHQPVERILHEPLAFGV